MHENIQTIYCYGDSNTWGYDSRSLIGMRYPKDVRWTGILEKESGLRIVNDGVNGRKIPDRKTEFDFLRGNLEREAASCQSLSLWIMLGTNDMLYAPVTAEAAGYTAARMDKFFTELIKLNLIHKNRIGVRLISPAVLKRGTWVETDELVRQSYLAGAEMKKIAQKYGIAFTDAGKMQIPLLYDGVHFSEEGHRAFAKAMYFIIMQRSAVTDSAPF